MDVMPASEVIAVGSPRETSQQSFTNGIIDNDLWMQMLKTRNIIIKQGCRKTGSPETKALIHVCQKR